MGSIFTRDNLNDYPSLQLSRNRFDLSHTVWFPLYTGDLQPVSVIECLPGDTFDINPTTILRGTSPIYPVLDNAYYDLYAFFVPNRLVWRKSVFTGANTDGWESWITGGDDPNNWATPTNVNPPVLQVSALSNTPITTSGITGVLPNQGYTYSERFDRLLDGLQGIGVTNGVCATSSTSNLFVPADGITCFRLRGYNLIYNEWFRDQNLQSALYFNPTSANDVVSPSVSQTNYLIRKVNKNGDYFTRALPNRLKGPNPLLPLQGQLPLLFGSSLVTNPQPVILSAIGGGPPTPNQSLTVGNSGFLNGGPTTVASGDNISIANGYVQFTPPVSGSGVTTGAGIDISDLRLAVQTAKYQERNARAGSRYTEYLWAMFGLKTPDSRLQRPELIGHWRETIKNWQVSNTSQLDTSVSQGARPLGDLGAFTYTRSSARNIRYSCQEHGHIHIYVCVRTQHSYSQGLHKSVFKRNNRLDYYNNVFKNISEQPVYSAEMYRDSASTTEANYGVFGFRPYGDEYRYLPDRAIQEMRPDKPTNNLGLAWTYQDYHTSRPTLNGAWLLESGNEVARTLAVPNAIHWWGQINFQIIKTSIVDLYSIPQLIDHN